jgi:hypothetical protein
MTNRFRWIATLACLAMVTGCIEFEQETVTYRHDAKSDTLRFFQHYQGIFGADKEDGLSDQEQEQLNSVLTTERTFFFANWIFEFNREDLREWLANLKKPVTVDEFKAVPGAIERSEVLLKLLLDNVRVQNGDFYLGEGGKLCGVQRVTMKNVSKIFAAANESIRDYYRVEALKSGTSDEERALFKKSTAEPRTYLKLEGNRLSLRLPITRADYDKSFGPGAESSKQLGEFTQAGGSIAFVENELVASIGKVADKETSLTLSMAEKPYRPNLVAAVKAKPGVKEKLDVNGAREEFFKRP